MAVTRSRSRFVFALSLVLVCAPGCSDEVEGGSSASSTDGISAAVAEVELEPGEMMVSGHVYADNYFELYVDGVQEVVDPVAFTPHQAVAVAFPVPADGPRTYAFLASDFATDSGYEYIDTDHPKLGDGGIIISLSDGTVSSGAWKCMTVRYGPTEASDATGCGPSNLEACEVEETAIPTDWATPGFDDSAWYGAVEYTAEAVGWGRRPSYVGGECCTLTDPYTREDADPSCLTMEEGQCLEPEGLSWANASFIWGPDLERVNTLLCRLTVQD